MPEVSFAQWNPSADSEKPESWKIETIGVSEAPVKSYGQTVAHEFPPAESGLRWLAEHQDEDGSWSFNHRRTSCQGNCQNPGTLSGAKNFATPMVLLSFAGAGNTHNIGKYKKVISSGLSYLLKSMELGYRGNDLRDKDSDLYAQGMAALFLCENSFMVAYESPDDDRHRPTVGDRAMASVAQLSLNSIIHAQDRRGGWRFRSQEKTSIPLTGLQLMALQSGRLAGLNVPDETMDNVRRYLDSIQSDGGARYGYRNARDDRLTTAIGLLSRIYLGWPRDEEALKRGVEYLTKDGPSKNDLYYNYLVTHVLVHYTETEGEIWKQWNKSLRDMLIDAQARKDHERGSWYFAEDPQAQWGGRVYCTAMAVMTLEVYYRYLNIYAPTYREKM